MTDYAGLPKEALAQLETWLKSDVYQDNIAFWERAWGGVKAPYTQLPDLPYLSLIPEKLRNYGARRVLDLGCGSGWLSIYLARNGFDVTGIDVSGQALRLAKTWASQEDLDIHFDTGDMAALPYPPGSFDAVVANSIFEHLTFQLAEAAIAEMKSIIIPGGTFFGCFDKVGGGPGEYYKLDDGTHVYTDKGRRGMMLRYFSDDELLKLLSGWKIDSMETLESGSRVIWAHN
jgi:SAM-dependent methyltransferase